MVDTSGPDSGDAVTDRVLVTHAQGGDQAAMTALLTRHFDYVHAVCRRILRDPGDAEDARQDALIRAARYIAQFDGRSEFRTWLHALTRNVCLNVIRAKSRVEVPVDELPEPAAGGYQRGDQDAVATRLDVEAALAALPEAFRDTVVLRYLFDLDYAQIAQTLDIPINTVRTRLRRGRAELIRLLGEP
jgi:RNA polymerase sigma-70 factor (ECF subfamily)